MKKRKIMIAAASIAIVATLSIGGTLAYFTDNDLAKDNLNAGQVNIEITERTSDKDAQIIKDENNLVTSIIYDNVLPGEEISKEPRVILKSDSVAAYIRAKIKVEGIDGDFSVKDGLEKYLQEIKFDADENDWVLGNGGYYYYQKEVSHSPKKDKSVTVFTKTFIPNEWDEDTYGKKFKIVISAEAIQSENFEPIMEKNRIVGWDE